MLNVPATDARNRTIVIVPPVHPRPHDRLQQNLNQCGDFTLLECVTVELTQHAIVHGSRVALMVLQDEDDVRRLEQFIPHMRSNDVSWIGLITPTLVPLPAVRACIAEQLFNFMTLPVRPDYLLLMIRHAWGMAYVRSLQAPMSACVAPEAGRPMIGTTLQMQKLFCQITKVARTDAPVLITGASGTGKELAALSIHRQSRRRGGPFVAVNCGAIAPQLFQSELFGHEKGAFTGAAQRKIGRIEAAQGGTLFLDEIGDMPFDMQVNLLRFLQEKSIERVGSTEVVPIDVRVIAATHVDLAEAVTQRRFREDLYYRINVVCIMIPRLAERSDDIEDLAQHYFAKFAGIYNRSLRGFSKSAMQALLCHSWPGNVRELVNRVQRAAVMAEGRFIQPEDLGFDRSAERIGTMRLEDARAAAERVTIRQALSQARNQVSHAALLLGVSRVTLYRLIDKYNLHHQAPATLTNSQVAANDMPVAPVAMLSVPALQGQT